MSSKSDHLSRVAEVEDIERIEKSWTKCAKRDGLTIPKKALNELHKRIKQASTKDAKAKLDFSKCGLDDGLIMTLMEALATAPVISKIDLKGNNITNKSANFILRLLRGQVTLIRTVPIDDRLSAAFLGEFSIDSKEVSDDIYSEVHSISDILRHANAIAHIRKTYIDYGAPTVMNSMSITDLWTSIVGKPDKNTINKAMNNRSSVEYVLNYDELERVILDALVLKGICPKIPGWAGEKIGLKTTATVPTPTPTPVQTLSVPSPSPAPTPIAAPPSPINVLERRGIPEEKSNSPVTPNNRDSPRHMHGENNEVVDDMIVKRQVDNEEKNRTVTVSSTPHTEQRKSVRYVDTDQEYYNSSNLASPISVSLSSPKKLSPNRHSFYGFGDKRMSSATIESPESLGHKSPKRAVDENETDAQEFIDQIVSSACLDLGNQGVSDLNIADIFDSQLSSIKILILRQNTVSRPDLMGLTQLTELTNLDLAINSIEGKLPDNCIPHTLINLDLSYNLLTDISGVLCCINLKTLNVAHNQLKKIIGLPPLIEKVNLSDNLLASPVTLRVISACPKIWAVGIAGNPLLNKIADWRAQLVSLCPKVVEIDGVLRPGYKLKVKEPKKEELPPPLRHTRKPTKKQQLERDRARIQYHNDQQRLIEDMRIEFQSNLSAPPKYLDKGTIQTLTKRLSEPLKPRGQNSRPIIVKAMSVKQAEIIVLNWLQSSSLEIGRAVAVLNMVMNMRETSGPIDAEQLMYFNSAINRVSFAREFVLSEDVDVAMSTLPDDNSHAEIIQSTAETLENMASFTAVLQSMEEVLAIPDLSGEDLAPAIDAIMLSEYGVVVNENILKAYGSQYEPLSQVEEIEEVVEEELDEEEELEEELEPILESKNDSHLYEMKMRIQARAIQGAKGSSQDEDDEILLDEIAVENSPLELNDFNQNVTITESPVEADVEADTNDDTNDAPPNTEIEQSGNSDDNLSTKERLRARIEEKRIKARIEAKRKQKEMEGIMDE